MEERRTYITEKWLCMYHAHGIQSKLTWGGQWLAEVQESRLYAAVVSKRRSQGDCVFGKYDKTYI